MAYWILYNSQILKVSSAPFLKISVKSSPEELITLQFSISHGFLGVGNPAACAGQKGII